MLKGGKMSKKKTTSKKLEGNCVGLADGKVVIKSKSIKRVMDTLINKYPDSEVSIASVPKGNKIFIL